MQIEQRSIPEGYNLSDTSTAVKHFKMEKDRNKEIRAQKSLLTQGMSSYGDDLFRNCLVECGVREVCFLSTFSCHACGLFAQPLSLNRSFRSSRCFLMTIKGSRKMMKCVEIGTSPAINCNVGGRKGHRI